MSFCPVDDPSPPEWVFVRAQERAWLGDSLADAARDLRVLGATPSDVAYTMVAPVSLGHGLDHIDGDALREAGFSLADIERSISANPPQFVAVLWDGREEPMVIPATWVATTT